MYLAPTLPLVALGVLCLLFAAAWAWQLRTRNAGIVDLLWGSSIGLLGLLAALTTQGWAPRRALVAILVGLWSVRLTWHLAKRIAEEAEDGRYAILRERWGPRFQSWMLIFFLLQACLAVLLSLPFWVLGQAQASGWRWCDGLALAFFVLALVGESIADAQLRRWRADPANRGRSCDQGLWAYSRHPNYFFEWLVWWVYPLMGIGLPWGLTLWAAPALMLFLVLKVTGIPPTEEQSLRSRGDDYRDYQARTPAFFPGLPRKSSPENSKTP